jgi:protein gp37
VSETTAIAWCDATFNIAWGCEKVSEGCRFCYALALAKRMGFDIWGPDKPRRVFGPKHWNEPLKWLRKWREAGNTRRMRIFTSSMADVFEDHPQIDAEREKLWPLIRATPEADWLVLTKRVDRMAALLPDLPNVWAIASIENQETADERLPFLRHVYAPIIGVSYEPALGVVDFSEHLTSQHPDERLDCSCHINPPCGRCSEPITEREIHWVIVGGESGGKHREMPETVVADTIRQCRAAGVPVFVKQDSSLRPGAWGRIPPELRVREFPVSA